MTSKPTDHLKPSIGGITGSTVCVFIFKVSVGKTKQRTVRSIEALWAWNHYFIFLKPNNRTQCKILLEYAGWNCILSDCMRQNITLSSFYSVSAAEIQPAGLRLSLPCLTPMVFYSTHRGLHIGREWKLLLPLICRLHHPALTRIHTFLMRCCCNAALWPVCWFYFRFFKSTDSNAFVITFCVLVYEQRSAGTKLR